MKPITTDEEYGQALAEIRRLWGSETGTPEHGRLAALAEAIDAYEAEHWPIIGELGVSEKRKIIFQHAREIGMLLCVDKADVFDAILSVLPEQERVALGIFQEREGDAGAE